jgi:hypothetical protein
MDPATHSLFRRIRGLRDQLQLTACSASLRARQVQIFPRGSLDAASGKVLADLVENIGSSNRAIP